MPFPVSISFPPNSLPLRTSPTMSHSSGSPQHPRRNPPHSLPSNSKRARPRGLWKARGSGPRLTPGVAAPPPSTPADVVHRRLNSEYDSDDDQASCSSSAKRLRKHSGSDTPLSTDLDDTPHVQPLVTKHQQHHPPQDYFSAFPHSQSGDDSSGDESANWITRTKLMDISTTAGPGDPTATFTYEDWLDLKQLFTKACEQYEFNNPVETLPLLRGVIHECHRCLLTYHDPSHLFMPPNDPAVDPGYPGAPSVPEPSTPKTQGPPNPPTELPTAFHSLLGTTLFYFANSIAANPELALPGEPPNPVPYWIAALDVFESGENLPSRTENYSRSPTYTFQAQVDEYDPPIHEDWRMAIMWGRTLVSLGTEMVDRNRGKPPPPPEARVFASPIPTNADYLKTGTIWDDEPRWPRESPFGVITARRPPITRRMSLNDATPHEILQLAMDHFSRGIFHMPHNSSSAASTPSSSKQPALPQFTRTKALYEIADEVLLLAEKLEDPEERKEWAAYADSVFSQIHLSLPYRFQEHSLVSSSLSRDTSDPRPPISEGMIAKARGQAWLAIGSTTAEAIEERMDQDSESDTTVGTLIQSEEAEEARDALARAAEFFERAAAFIGGEPEVFDEEEAAEAKDNGDDGDDDTMIIDDNDDDADDEEEPTASISARARGKQREDMRTEETRRLSRPKATRISRLDARKLRQQEAEAEKRQLSHLLAEALCSLANLTESRQQQEEYYRRAEAATGSDLFGDDRDDGMDEDR